MPGPYPPARLKELANRPVILGGGLAGIMTALYLAPRPCILVAKSPLGINAASGWAQGGIAAALGSDDAPELHAADTVAAGDGLVDPAVALRVARSASLAIGDLERFGVRFDRDAAGNRLPGLEAAHRRRRVLHVGADGSGKAIHDALIRRVRETPSIEVIEGAAARQLLVEDGRIAGVTLDFGSGHAGVLLSPTVVLATGGLGGLFAATTNPLSAIGDGVDLAARAGAELRDMEFVQFHPTALDLGSDPMALATEALRGEGAVLIDAAGQPIMAGVPGGDLAPRDVVARAVFRARRAGRVVFLDARAALGARMATRFPRVTEMCRKAGLDPVSQPMPVRPAAHYHMGGVKVDRYGRSSVDGLWAVGEVASTGLHGANRLASNSLLEGAVFARAVAQDILASVPRRILPRPRPAEAKQSARLKAPGGLRRIMDAHVGVERDAPGLAQAIGALSGLIDGASAEAGARVALVIAVGAYLRHESRGAHQRSDHPAHAAEARSSVITLDQALTLAGEIAPARRRAAQ